MTSIGTARTTVFEADGPNRQSSVTSAIASLRVAGGRDVKNKTMCGEAGRFASKTIKLDCERAFGQPVQTETLQSLFDVMASRERKAV
jgi:hypothetical protein